MSDKDYGYFGKGLSGYTHYMQSFKSTCGENGGGKRSNKPNGERKISTTKYNAIGLTIFIIITVIIALIEQL